MAAQVKGNRQFQPIKIENSTAYRDPVQTQTYPSPPYEGSYDNYSRLDQSAYLNYPTPTNQSQPRQLTTSQYGSTNQNAVSQSNSAYSTSHGSPYNNPNHTSTYRQSMTNQGSPGHHMAFESVASAQGSNGDLISQSHGGHSYGDVRQQRHSCEVAAKQRMQQDLKSPYAQVSVDLLIVQPHF